MNSTLNAIIARLTFLTNGQVGLDWRSGKYFVLAQKGDVFVHLQDVLEDLRKIRKQLEEVE